MTSPSFPGTVHKLFWEKMTIPESPGLFDPLGDLVFRCLLKVLCIIHVHPRLEPRWFYIDTLGVILSPRSKHFKPFGNDLPTVKTFCNVSS